MEESEKEIKAKARDYAEKAWQGCHALRTHCAGFKRDTITDLAGVFEDLLKKGTL